MKYSSDTLVPSAAMSGGAPARLRFDRTVWPYLVGRTQDTATAVEFGQILMRLGPWVHSRADLLAMWIDESPHPDAWFDATAVRAMTHWMIIHQEELAGRHIAIAFVSPHVWKRRELESRIGALGLAHSIAVDVFASESVARGWLSTRGVMARGSRRAL